MNQPKSLILITVDCLRADHTGMMGYGRPTTPFLDRLAAESFVFPKAIACGAPTYYSFPGIMASRFPLAMGRATVGLAPGEPTLARTLQQAGYRTAAYVAGNPYLTSRFGYDQGFDVFQDFLTGATPEDEEKSRPESASSKRSILNRKIASWAHSMGPLGKLYDELYFYYRHRVIAPKGETWNSLRRFPAADIVVDQASEWLATLGGAPFFLWLHFMDPHAPYYPQSEALSAMGDGAIGPARGRYLNAAWLEHTGNRLHKYRDAIVRLHDAGIRWVDTQLARLVETLRSRSLWNSCLFGVTADHGEEFLDHGGRFHYPSRVFQEMLHVPLLLRVPDAQKKELSAMPFSHLHLAPTILDAMGIEAPPEFAGRSYWSEMQKGEGCWEFAISESIGRCTNPMDASTRGGGRVMAVQDRRFKLIFDFDSDREEFFDLENDPGEQNVPPLEVNRPERIRLLQYASRHLASTAHLSPKREMMIRARLREVGIEWKHSKMASKTIAS